jgi:iron complex outermembrane receptor protein
MTRVRDFLVALAMTLAVAVPLQAQETGAIRGRVLDASFGGPLPTVVITVGNRSTLSDAEGNFAILEMPVGTYDLRATRIGFREAVISVTVEAGQAINVEVQMQLAPVGLTDLVVVGFGESEARDVTGAIQAVPPEQFNRGRIVSTEELIQAKVPGVQVVDSGEPGGGVNIRIRGGTSVTSSNEPLFVIDGVPIAPGGGLSAGRNPLNFLNPEDIESITVLKDASSTAIYGSQGANGVIMITTKAGKRGEGRPTQISYRGTVSGSSISQRADVLNSAEYRQAVADNASPEVGTRLGNENTDWLNLIEQGAFGTDHTLTVAGGSTSGDFRFSLGYLNQKGVLKGTKLERYTLSAAYNQLLFDDLMRIQANILGSRNDDMFTPGGVLGGAVAFAPTEKVLDEDSPYGGFFEWEDPLGVNNPMGELELRVDDGTTYRSVGNLTTQGFIPGAREFSITARLGYDVTKAERRGFAPSFLKAEAEGGEPGQVSRSNNTEFSGLFDLFANWTDRIGESSFDVTGGYSYYHFTGSYPFFEARGLAFDFLGPNGVPTASFERTFLDTDETKVIGFFARANYGYKDRYLLTGSIRRDGSSKFGRDDQWGWFPSAAIAWRVSEEPFMASTDWLSDLKLRGSWGINGNSAFDSFLAFKSFFAGDAQAQAQFGDRFVSTLRPAAVDPNLRWEQTESWNIGLDYGFWDQRLFGSFEVYNKKTKDLIFLVPVAAGSNLSDFVTTNIGNMKNTGFEFNLNAVILDGRGGGVAWDGNFNAAYIKNEITQINPIGGGSEQILVGGIAGGVGSRIQVLQPGSAINTFYTLRHIRDSNGKPIYEDRNGDGTIDDFDLYEDINGDGIVNQDDRVAERKPAPDWILGHTTLLGWKNWDMAVTFLAYLGNYVYNNVASNNGNYDVLINSNAPGQLHRSVLENGFVRPQFLSDAYVEDGSFLRLTNLELGYTIRSGALTGMRIFGVVQNLFTLTGYSGVDPVSGVNGIDNNVYPRSRTFMGGLSVAF